MASEDRVGPLAPRSGVRKPVQHPRMAREEPTRRVLLGRHCRLASFRQWLVAVRQGSRHRLRVDPLLTELHPEGTLPARAGSITRFDPGLRKQLIIEHAEVAEPHERPGDQVLAIAGLGQAPAHLRDGALARLEEAKGRFEDDGRIIDGRATGAGLRRRLASRPMTGIPVR